MKQKRLDRLNAAYLEIENYNENHDDVQLALNELAILTEEEREKRLGFNVGDDEDVPNVFTKKSSGIIAENLQVNLNSDLISNLENQWNLLVASFEEAHSDLNEIILTDYQDFQDGLVWNEKKSIDVYIEKITFKKDKRVDQY